MSLPLKPCVLFTDACTDGRTTDGQTQDRHNAMTIAGWPSASRWSLKPFPYTHSYCLQEMYSYAVLIRF